MTNIENLYQNGRYIVTGSFGMYAAPKETHKTFRVVNTETSKLASAEFRTLHEAMFHVDSLVMSQWWGPKR